MDFIAKCSGHNCMGIKKGLSRSAERCGLVLDASKWGCWKLGQHTAKTAV